MMNQVLYAHDTDLRWLHAHEAPAPLLEHALDIVIMRSRRCVWWL